MRITVAPCYNLSKIIHFFFIYVTIFPFSLGFLMIYGDAAEVANVHSCFHVNSKGGGLFSGLTPSTIPNKYIQAS